MADQKVPHDDLFEGPSMTFGEHLEELRVALFKSVIGIVVCVLVGLVVANYVVRFFQSPLEEAMREYYLTTARDQMAKDAIDFTGGLPEEVKVMIERNQLLPEKVPVDVGQFAAALNEQFPGSINREAFSSYTYTAEDFRLANNAAERAEQIAKMRSFCQLIAAGKDKPKTPAGEVWQQLSEEDQQELTALAKEDTAEDSWHVDHGQKFLHILNRVIQKPELHKSPAIARLRTASLPRDLNGKVLPEPPFAPGTELDVTRQQNKRSLYTAFGESVLRQPAISTIKIWQWKPVRIKFQVLSAEESFMIWMKAGVVTGIALASPWIFYQIWLFVAAGLYRHEKSYIYIYLPFSIGLFLAGASLAFFFVFKPVLGFLFSFQADMNADFEPRIGEWMSFVLVLPLGFGISFQLPLVMLFLNRVGLVDINFYITNWRIAILTIFIVAMVLTPADPVSMLLMAVPLCFLYVLGIGLCKWMPRGRSPFEAAYEP